jgi:hypothetical protein
MSKHAANTDRLLPLAEEINFTWEGPSCRPQLPSVDDDSLIQGVEDAGVRISNNHTGHGTLLPWDQIHYYAAAFKKGRAYLRRRRAARLRVMLGEVTDRAVHADGTKTRTYDIVASSCRQALLPGGVGDPAEAAAYRNEPSPTVFRPIR